MHRSMVILTFWFMSFLLIGCGGTINYTKPMTLTGSEAEQQKYRQNVNFKIEDVWKATVDYIGSTFFVIDNMEKDSFFINLSFSASDPTQYIDCGVLHYTAVNRRWDFLGAAAYSEYMRSDGIYLLSSKRRATLNGKINILLSKVEERVTRIKVNARYIFDKKIDRYDGYGRYAGGHSYTMSFNTGRCGKEPGLDFICCPKHELEIDIIEGIKKRLSGT